MWLLTCFVAGGNKKGTQTEICVPFFFCPFSETIPRDYDMQTTMMAFYIGVKDENPNTTFFDRLVCWATSSRYSHVEVVTHYNEETGVGMCWSASPRDKGVRWANIYLNPKHWELYVVRTGLEPQFVKDWFMEQEGLRYDWIGAFATKLTFLKERANRWFCSETAAALIGLSNPHTYNPGDLHTHILSISERYTR